MSTTTDLLLLHQQVDSLTNYMNWTIAGVTLTITFLLGIFALVQFIFQRKMQKSDIETLKQSLTVEIETKLKEAEDRLKSFSETSLNVVEDSLKKDVSKINGDISRRFALDCDNDGSFANAFSWWLRAATEYIKSDSLEMYQISIGKAKDAIDKIETVSQKKSLFEASTRIAGYLDQIKIKHETEASLIRDAFEDKCKTKSIRS